VSPRPRVSPWLANPWLHVAIIVLVAGFFRLWLIDRIPPGLFGDEATDGLDALDVLAGRGAVFFPANFGREGLHMWIVAAAFRLLGATPLALRLPSAIAGILTAVATYWLGRELMRYWVLDIGDRRLETITARRTESTISNPQYLIPLLASLFLATSYWHIHFSRFGIRGVFTPLCGALAFAAFWHAMNQRINADDHAPRSTLHASRSTHHAPRITLHAPRTSPYVWFALSGFFLGLATHFYTASRFLPFFLGGFLILEWLIAWARHRPGEAILVRHFRGIVVLYTVAAVVFLPLGVYFLQHPGSFSQRAGEVAVTHAAAPWLRMGAAAAANVLQFFVPGRGDQAQFYNLPGRPVFDLLTAVLAVIGIGVLLWRWRRPAALFLLTWFPALLLPSFLATDRFPTLPRVLGVIPGVYFFPAVGLLAVLSLLISRWRSGGAEEVFSAPSRLRTSAPLLLCVLALLIPAGLTYRDYFRAWGPSQATFDAFEGDMASAWQWLEINRPAGHVYLSSDIYRHPTFMLLGEHATVQTYFQQQDPSLSWFDARASLPLPPNGQPATYLIGSSAPADGEAAEMLDTTGVRRDPMLAPDGTAALTVIEWPARRGILPVQEADGSSQAFTDQLTLVAASWDRGPDGAAQLQLTWRTAGPDPTNSGGYRLEIVAGGWSGDVPFDAFRPTEWVPGGSFITWHRLDLPGDPPYALRLRLVRVDNNQPAARPDAPDGWHEVMTR